MNPLPLFHRQNCDALLISNAYNIGYITSFWGSYGRVLLLKNGEVLLFSDGRYSEMAKELCRILPPGPNPRPALRGIPHPLPFGYLPYKGGRGVTMEYREVSHDEDFWERIAKEKEIKILGIEAEHTSLLQYKRLKKAFGSIVKLQKTENIIENLRKQKSEDEMVLLKKSAQINDEALTKLLPYIREGVTEKELAWTFERIARENLGAEKLSFSTLVAFGANSATPHHSAGEAKLKKNMPFLVDCGVRVSRYCSDMTRSFFYGKPSNEWLKTYDLVLQAQEAGIQKMEEGEKISAPDKAAREVFGDEEKYFTHSFGHGVGLEIHEAPGISSKSKGKFGENMVVTAEPGLYYPTKFGIRIEDLLVVKKDGTEIFSAFPKGMKERILS